MDPPECSTNTSYILHLAFNTSKNHPLPSAMGNEIDVLRPLSTYEKGSTSVVPRELRNKDSEVVMPKGRTPTTKSCPIIGQLRSNYALLKKVPICKFCSAKRFQYEPPTFCCGSGTIKLTSHQMPTKLRNLFLGNSVESKHFRTYIRTYNNLFAFTSLGVKYDKDLAKRSSGIYTFRVQGKMYHWINNLHTTDDKPRNIQLYIYDNCNDLAHRMACSARIHESVVKELMDILSINPYSVFLRSLVHIPNLQDFHIALICDLNLDQRVYNLPTSSEIAAIWTEENDSATFNAPHIQIYSRTDRARMVNYYYGCYDALQYPLLFPLGQSGWHCGIKKLPANCPAYLRIAHHEEVPSIRNVTSLDGYLEMEVEILKKGQRRRDTVSVREYYCYELQMRNDDEDEILHTGRISQQYSVDEYVKLETQRLDFAVFNQDLFRMAMLQGLLDILRLGERDASNIGKQNFLPSSFIGGPRDMRQRYMDAIALVQHFSKPDLFITMTCNPSWMEIKEHLISTDEAHNRPDLISRVFRAKIEEFKNDILKRNIFGKVAAFMYTVEFQKQGLPHVHFLIILTNEYKLLTPEAYDNIIRAEIPDENAEPDLYSLVLKHMMHGPCGNLNPTNSCMKKKGYCKFKYPKSFADRTSKGVESYPIYRRRNTGLVVKIREQYLDNSWVVPYNPFLLGKFDCHVNVEICSDIKVVKYLYKYICKGHDKIAFSVHNNDTNTEVDEIKEYHSATWVSPPEAMWRLYGFSISEMSPTACSLQLHLKGQQFVSFRSSANVDTLVNNPLIKQTMLTHFFEMNRTNAEAMKLNLLYREFPEHFVWSATERMWTPRKHRYAIGRVVTCHPIEGERYYLRMLLMTIRGPKSYNDLLTVNRERCSSFRESVEKRGLLQSDNSLLECMSEVASYQMPYSLRHLFAILLIYCNPTNPRQLWEQFEEHMSEDYKLVPNIQKNDIRYRVLNHINDILHSMGGDINEYQLIPETIRPSVAAKEAKEVHFERTIAVTNEDILLHKKLNKDQLKAYNIIIERIFSNKAGAFFIDRPGGTGKTFLYRALLATVRSKRYIALATATSGVAASILPGGRTAHSRFKIPINTDENVTCNISKQSSLACLIQDAKLIIWDEVSMAKKRTIELLDLLLKDLMDSTILFGGKVVVFGGDFRQTLPVVRNGKKEDFINESLLYSHIWEELERLRLFKNMRAKDDPSFCNYLLRIENGEEKVNSANKIEIATSLIIPYTTEKESLDKLFAITYPDVHTFFFLLILYNFPCYLNN
uniref:ATP-dependent DNA helicase n=1 Tax=Nicotiana tabacum TaxID=4097 RepID=A0A1S3ZR79_TOBAC|nr:PREDICTED: uncharacterized protein LOC107789465 [Nicotiana tabacum]